MTTDVRLTSGLTRTIFFIFFNSSQKNKKKYKKCPGTRVTGLGCPVTLVPGFPSKHCIMFQTIANGVPTDTLPFLFYSVYHIL
jgi:hypothetical protein